MAYNRLNHLKKVLEIQEIWNEYNRNGKGHTDVWIFRNMIRDKYFISMGTFYNYLSIPAKKQIKEIEAAQLAEKENPCIKQKSLFQ